MTVYVAQAYVAFDGADQNDAWALGLAQWVKDNTEVLGGQALITPGTAGERSSYCVVSEMAIDGSLIPISAWHVNDLGVIAQGLPNGIAAPPPDPDPVGPAAWVPWDGNNANLYQIGDRVTHNGQTWEATAANNHWEPGVFGWVVV